jgi:hypothetical protein
MQRGYRQDTRAAVWTACRAGAPSCVARRGRRTLDESSDDPNWIQPLTVWRAIRTSPLEVNSNTFVYVEPE